jgi:hypothetical protein
MTKEEAIALQAAVDEILALAVEKQSQIRGDVNWADLLCLDVEVSLLDGIVTARDRLQPVTTGVNLQKSRSAPCPARGKSRITNGTALLPGIDGRSPDATAAEQAIIRRAAVLIVELERMEAKFALAGEADPATLDLYGRVAGNMRRLLEAVGLQRRPRDVSDPLEYSRKFDEDDEDDERAP